MTRISGSLTAWPEGKAELRFSIGADTGSPEEAAGLTAMSLLIARLDALHIPYETFKRNTLDGKKVDQVRITL